MSAEAMPICPICGTETNDFYVSEYGLEIIGCTECVKMVDAWERSRTDKMEALMDYVEEMRFE